MFRICVEKIKEHPSILLLQMGQVGLEGLVGPRQRGKESASLTILKIRLLSLTVRSVLMALKDHLALKGLMDLRENMAPEALMENMGLMGSTVYSFACSM